MKVIILTATDSLDFGETDTLALASMLEGARAVGCEYDLKYSPERDLMTVALFDAQE